MSGITLRRRFVRGGHGADDYEDDLGRAYTIEARLGERIVGALDYNLKDGGRLVWVRWIEVEPAFRRRAIARALIAEAQRLHPGADVATGGLTEDGTQLWAKLFGP